MKMEKNNGGVEEKIKNKKWFGNCVKLSLYLKIKTGEKLFLKLVLFYSETTCINITPQVFFFCGYLNLFINSGPRM